MDEGADTEAVETSSKPDARPESGGLDRTVLGYALLFSVPVFVGVTMMMLKVTGGRPLGLVLAPGFVIGVVLFAFVLLATRGGYATE